MPIYRRAFRPIPAAVALALYAAGAAANPQGGVVKAGSATITPNGSRLDVVQSSQRAVIDWRSFSIGAGGHVDFKQPSAASATLNRVTGPQASAILGRLTANGTVFLVNPNGILIGPGAKIDVGGLVALVAPGVENSGVIRAELGRVVLASGNRFTLDLFGDRLVAFAVDDKVAARLTDVEGRPLKAYVSQTGRIEADGGSILIAASAAKAVLDNVINTGGVVRATSFAQRGGEIVLHGGDEGVVRVAGTLDATGRASGASGGSVKVLGAEVVLEPGSRIDVAGDAGGGTALVGGGVQGGGGVFRSSRTTIEAGATVNADALTSGNGGSIVAWSDGETRFAGALSARGGPGGGDGGFVEVSGKRELAFAGAVDVAGPAGKGGRLLLDPEFLVVDAVTAGTVAGVLRSGANAELAASQTIDVRERIDGRGGAKGGALTLSAADTIELSSDILTNDGKVSVDAGVGGIRMKDGTVIHAGNGEIALVAMGDVHAQYLATTGAVEIKSSAGGVTLKRDLGGPPGEGIGSLGIVAATGAELRGVNARGAVSVATSGADGTIVLEGPLVAKGSVMIGDSARKAATSIRLRNDIYTENADITLNGRTWIDPVVQPGGANVAYSNLFRLSSPRYYENPLIQVSLRTSGVGGVHFNGDVLWGGGGESSLPKVPYIYNVLRPPPFDSRVPAQVEALRASQSPQPVGYFGLNVEVDRGPVEFLGKLGMFTGAGVERYVAAPRNTLVRTEVPTILSVSVNTSTFSRDEGSADIAFGADSRVTVGRFHIANPASANPGYDSIDVVGVSSVFRGTPPNVVVPLAGNMPNLPVSSGGPNLIAPSPRNVTKPASFATLPPLPEIPVVDAARTAGPAAPVEAGLRAPTLESSIPASTGAAARRAEAAPAAEGLIRATFIEDPGRGAGARDRTRPPAPADVSGTDGPLVPFAGDRAPGADPEYFSQGAFEFVQSLERRAPASR